MRVSSILFLLLFFIMPSVFGQFYGIIKTDTIRLKNDSLVINTSSNLGVIDWQILDDQFNWNQLKNNVDTLSVKLDSTVFYRAVLTDGTCDPVFSDSIQIFEKVTILDSSLFSIDSNGGIYKLPSGIKFILPEKTINESTEIQIDTLSFLDVTKINESLHLSEDNFHIGFQLQTDGIDFTKPVKFKIKIPDSLSNFLPVLYEYDSLNENWFLANSKIVTSPLYNYIEIEIEPSQNSTDARVNFSLNSIRNFILNLYLDIFHSEDPCREINYYVDDRDMFYESSDDCSIATGILRIVYDQCDPVQTESHEIKMFTAKCDPFLSRDPGGGLMIRKSESETVTLYTGIRNTPLEKQEIKLTASNNLYISNPIVLTNDAGKKTISITGVNTGYGSVGVSVNFTYYLTSIHANVSGQQVFANKDPIDITPPQDPINVFVYDNCTHPREIDCSKINNPKCNEIKEKLIDRVEFNTDAVTIKEGGGEVINAIGYNIKNVSLGTPKDLLYVSMNPAVASVGPSGSISGNKEGKTQVNVYRCDAIIHTVGVTVIKPPDPPTTDPDICDQISWVGSTIEEVYLDLNESITALVGAFDSNDNLITDVIFIQEWISSNPSIVSVNDGELIAYGKEGTAYITVKLCEFELTIPVHVIDRKECSFIDERDGQIYKCIEIGEQTWMAENLNYDASGSFCDQGIDLYCETSGRLYTYYSALEVCPAGWHLPSSDEWRQLEMHLGYEFEGDDLNGTRGAEVNLGGKLKEAGTAHWEIPNYGATNESGFTALPGGKGDYIGNPDDRRFGEPGGWVAYFWTATESPIGGYSVTRQLFSTRNDVIKWNINNLHVISVRCVQDQDAN